MAEDSGSGSHPSGVVRYTTCGEVNPAQGKGEGGSRPISVPRGCKCGNDEFTPVMD